LPACPLPVRVLFYGLSRTDHFKAGKLALFLAYQDLEKGVNMDREKLTGLSGRRKGKKQVKKLGRKMGGGDDIELRFGTIAVEKGLSGQTRL